MSIKEIDYEVHAVQRMSDGETVDYKREYEILLDKFNHNVRNYNYTIERYDELNQALESLRERYEKERDKINTFHTSMVEFHTHMRTMFRAKQIKSLTEYNQLVNAWGKVSNGWLKPIKAEDLFSAKASIVIEGTYTNDNRNVQYIKDIISRGFENFGDNSVSVKFVDVEDIYDVEELTSTEEG
jgi:chromosome segregation ATPase